jgi:8-hydroxy-5-deazaflavin:NADPH oxidoreductase
MTTIAVIGAGRIGGTLGRAWSLAGHRVIFGARDPRKPELQALAEEANAQASSIPEAVAAADVVLFAVPGAAMKDAVTPLGNTLDGRIVIDATNDVRGPILNAAAVVAEAAAGAAYVRAFSTLGWEIFANPIVGGVQADLVFCAADGPPRQMMEDLITDVGLRPVWLGGPEEVDAVDAAGRVWLTLVLKRGWSRRLALKLIRD